MTIIMVGLTPLTWDFINNVKHANYTAAAMM